MFFGQLVCAGCQRILTYPLGAVTCRCRICNVVNSAPNMQITCGACGQHLLVPINTVSLLCPLCATITDLDEDLLPPLPTNINLGDGTEEMEAAIYVSHPTLHPHPAASPAPPVEGQSAPASEAPSRTHDDQRKDAQRSRPARRSREEREADGGNRVDHEWSEVDDSAEDGEEVEMQTLDVLPKRTSAAEATPAATATATASSPERTRPRLTPTVMIATRIL